MNASAWLQAWDSQGIHRTGMAGDTAGAEWLAREAESLGGTVSIETFGLSRIDPVSCWLETKDRRIDGVPVFDSPPTGPGGVGGPIGVTSLFSFTGPTPEYHALRRSPDHSALVIVCQGAVPGLALLNAGQFLEPYGCPAIQVTEAPCSKPLRLVSDYQRNDATAGNVVVAISGRDRTRRPVVVMTPRSSWWQSTSERGGGLVCWLETLRALIDTSPTCDVVMTANTGHELGYLGLDEFLRRRPGWDRPGGAIWVHYGANIGARGGKLSIQSADGSLREAMRNTLTEAGQPPDVMAPETLVPVGETRDIHCRGGRYVTLFGTNPLFHLPQDRWPHAVDVPAIERFAAGAAAMVRVLTS